MCCSLCLCLYLLYILVSPSRAYFPICWTRGLECEGQWAVKSVDDNWDVFFFFKKKIYCQESMYCMFEAKLQNTSLSITNGPPIWEESCKLRSAPTSSARSTHISCYTAYTKTATENLKCKVWRRSWGQDYGRLETWHRYKHLHWTQRQQIPPKRLYPSDTRRAVAWLPNDKVQRTPHTEAVVHWPRKTEWQKTQKDSVSVACTAGWNYKAGPPFRFTPFIFHFFPNIVCFTFHILPLSSVLSACISSYPSRQGESAPTPEFNGLSKQ